MVVLLAACAPSSGPSPPAPGSDTAEPAHDSAADLDSAPRDTSADTGRHVDTAPDTGDPFDPAICALPEDAPPLACTLTAPGPVDETTIDAVADELLHLAPALDYGQLASRWDCTSSWTSDAGELVGDCTDSDGSTWTGTASWADDGSWVDWTFDAFTETTADGAVRTWSGTWRYLQVDEGYYAEADLTATFSGDPDVADGALVVTGEIGSVNARFSADAQLTNTAGEYCFAANVSYGYGCANLYGWSQVQGEQSATLVELGRWPECACGCWDPSDGEPEEFCRE